MNAFNKTNVNERLILLCLSFLSFIFLTGCGVSNSGYTRGELFPKMYTEKPGSVLIMPPINLTNHVDAKEYFYSSLMMPLTERGYYVFPPYLSAELLQQESANDAEMFIEGSLKPFQNVFNTDAVLFTIIKKWDKGENYSINVEAEYILKSTHTNEILFQRNADIIVDCRVSKDDDLASVLVNVLFTAATDKIVGARKTNSFIVRDMPVGKYSLMHGTDNNYNVESRNIEGTTVR